MERQFVCDICGSYVLNVSIEDTKINIKCYYCED